MLKVYILLVPNDLVSNQKGTQMQHQSKPLLCEKKKTKEELGPPIISINVCHSLESYYNYLMRMSYSTKQHHLLFYNVQTTC